MQKLIIDCSTGEESYVDLTPEEEADARTPGVSVIDRATAEREAAFNALPDVTSDPEGFTTGLKTLLFGSKGS